MFVSCLSSCKILLSVCAAGCQKSLSLLTQCSASRSACWGWYVHFFRFYFLLYCLVSADSVCFILTCSENEYGACLLLVCCLFIMFLSPECSCNSCHKVTLALMFFPRQHDMKLVLCCHLYSSDSLLTDVIIVSCFGQKHLLNVNEQQINNTKKITTFCTLND